MQYAQYTNSQIKALIDEYIHSKRDREILYMRFVDGVTLEGIGAAFGLDTKTVWRIIHKNEKELFSHIPG